MRPGAQAGEVKVLFSHPQALAQCRRFVERCFPKAEVVAALSTAAAVEEMMAREGAAAIATAARPSSMGRRSWPRHPGPRTI